MSQIKFSDLKFDQVGCCDSHPWAVVNHANGRVSSVYDRGEGRYAVVTHAVGMVVRGEQLYATQGDVETRLQEDAS